MKQPIYSRYFFDIGFDEIISESNSSFLWIYKGMSDYSTFIHELKRKEFDVSCIHPVTRNRLLRIVKTELSTYLSVNVINRIRIIKRRIRKYVNRLG